MFARKLSVQLRPNKLAEFTQTFESEIIPLLRKQPGFSDEIMFAASDGMEVQAISLWDTESNAASYSNGAYKDVLAKLQSLITGTPKILGTTEVIHSTFHHIRTGQLAA